MLYSLSCWQCHWIIDWWITFVTIRVLGWKLLLLLTGLPSEHPILGLEARRWCDMSGWVEVGVHCTELFSARVFHHDGQSVCYAFLQNGKLVKSVSEKYISQVSHFYVTYSFHILSSLFSVTGCRHHWLDDMRQWCYN
jgi:hypothetical protein